jgi:hypothetical protein
LKQSFSVRDERQRRVVANGNLQKDNFLYGHAAVVANLFVYTRVTPHDKFPLIRAFRSHFFRRRLTARRNGLVPHDPVKQLAFACFVASE